MGLKFIPESLYMEAFTGVAEHGHGYHLVHSAGEVPGIVLGGLVLFVFDEELSNDLDQMSDQGWAGALPLEYRNRLALFDAWLERLPRAEFGDVQGHDPQRALSLIVGPYSPATSPTPPARPRSLFGHLPFLGKADDDAVVYRFEAFPKSRRINQATGQVSTTGGLYCAPPSDLPFVPTGLAAVGRYALPNLAPARYRWELRPPKDTPFRCGASVPLYGQSGGGVELSLDQDFVNVGPIANPTILPIL